MGIQNAILQAFNRGIISILGLCRTDLKRTALSAEIQNNFMPRLLGSMMLRPGWGFISSTLNNKKAITIPFIFSSDVTAAIELTDSVMRVRVDDQIIQRVGVSTVINNGNFTVDLTGWTDADGSGCTSSWQPGGYMGLIGSTYNVALRTQQVAVAVSDIGLEHALHINIKRGPVSISVGSTPGGDDYISQHAFKTGTYSIAFNPIGDFYVWVFSGDPAMKLVDSIRVEAPGNMQLTTPWLESDLPNIRSDQSADVLFTACRGKQPMRIERYGQRSWGLAVYSPNNGPFRNINTGGVTIAPSALTGNITLTSSFLLFKPLMVGTLFRITSLGQNVGINATGNNQFSDPIQVVGVGTSRTFLASVSGTWTGTVIVQRSVGNNTSWTDTSYTFTTNGGVNITDGLDNQIVYYRIGFNAGYGSGTVTAVLIYSSGGLTGIARVTDYISPTSLAAEVLKPFGGLTGSVLWSEGLYSDYRGWPSSMALHEDRLWQAGSDNIDGSVTDGFENFDDETIGDSGPIIRTLGSGPSDSINWLLSLQRLIVGTDIAERVARSSSLDEPLTPTNYNLKAPSTRGSSAISPVKIDNNGIFAKGSRLFQLSYTPGADLDYTSEDLTNITPEIGRPGFVCLAVQRYPDTRVHGVRADGTAAVLLYDPIEDVKCWVTVTTSGFVEWAYVLPGGDGSEEDKVYYHVRRTINGQTVRYIEKWAHESECQGGSLNKQADSFIAQSNSVSSSVMSGLDHLEGETVVVWADGKSVGSRVVTGGLITGLPATTLNVMAGLPYTAQFKSSKLAYAASLGTALNQVKKVDHLGLNMVNTHARGLQYGPDFDNLDDLPGVEDGAVVDPDHIWDVYDYDAIEFDGLHDADSRLCLQAQAPFPVTLLSCTLTVKTSDKV